MISLPPLRSWIRAMLRRSELERTMHDEMQLHVELYEADLRKSGLSPAEASRRARAEFGSAEARKDECREAVGLGVVEEIRGDVIYALRLLRRSPGFALVALMSLGLGIGANTAIFSLVDTVLVKSLPVVDPAQLFFLDNSGGKSGGVSGPPYPCYEIWRDNNRFLSGIAAFDENRLKVTIDGSPELLTVQHASGSYFDVLGVGAAHGRVLTQRDDSAPGGGPDGAAAVISYGLWSRQFGRDPGVLGKTIEVGTQAVTIVGVTPPEFLGLNVGSPVDVTIPMALAGRNLASRELWWFSVVGRVKEDATVEQARGDLERLWDAYMNDIGQPAARRTYFSGIALVPAARGLEGLRRRFSIPLLIAMSIVGIVLLIGCANLANLLLARASVRREEIAVRLAIGATRGRLTRQLMTEGAVLVVLGTAAGLAFGRWGVSFLASVLATGGRITLDARFDARVFAFTAAVAATTGILFSIAPAWRARRVHAARPGVARASAGREQSRVGQVLVVTQVTLSVALLCAAGLFVRTLHRLNTLDVGFDSANVLTMQVQATVPGSDAQPSNFAQSRVDHARLGGIWETFVERVTEMPEVASAGVATMTPLTGLDRGVLIRILGGARFSQQDRYIHINQVTAGYFETMGVDLIAGRLFTPRDRGSAARVVILNESAARMYFGSGSAIGRIVRFPNQRVEDPYEVVGVVGDVRYESVRKPDERMAYLPVEQSLDPVVMAMLVIRGRGNIERVVPSIREAARDVVPSGFVSNVVTLDEQVSASLLSERLLSMLATFFGALALTLACIGLYGVMAQGVISRVREIAIRIAIGARRDTVAWMVVKSTVALLAVGVAIGAGFALVAGRLVRSQLFEVSPADPIAIAGSIAILMLVTLTASYLPVRRATRIEPAVALRAE